MSTFRNLPIRDKIAILSVVATIVAALIGAAVTYTVAPPPPIPNNPTGPPPIQKIDTLKQKLLKEVSDFQEIIEDMMSKYENDTKLVLALSKINSKMYSIDNLSSNEITSILGNAKKQYDDLLKNHKEKLKVLDEINKLRIILENKIQEYSTDEFVSGEFLNIKVYLNQVEELPIERIRLKLKTAQEEYNNTLQSLNLKSI